MFPTEMDIWLSSSLSSYMLSFDVNGLTALKEVEQDLLDISLLFSSSIDALPKVPRRS